MRRRAREALRALVDAGLNVTRGRPLEGRGALLRCLPWLAAGAFACTFLPLLSDFPSTGDLIAFSLFPVIVGLTVLVPWQRVPAWTQAIPPLIPFVMVALVRSSHESVTAAYTPCVLLPVIWFAFYGTRAQLLISTFALGITLAIPSPAFDGYPALEPIAALFWMGVAVIAGFSINELVRERERLQTRLGLMARTDALTGLPNRRAWDEVVEREIARAGRSGSPISIVLLDLDHFKEFNDLNGHPAGDSHLKQVAALWRERLRAADLVARYGGEEFAVVLTDTDLTRATQVAETLRSCVPREETVSAGVAEWDASESGVELLARADRALYEAKRRGRDRTVEARPEPALLGA